MKKRQTKATALLLALLLLLTGCGTAGKALTAAASAAESAIQDDAETATEVTKETEPEQTAAEPETEAETETEEEKEAKSETETETETEEESTEKAPETKETKAEENGDTESRSAEAGSFKGAAKVSKSELLDIYDLELLESCNLFSKRDGYGEYYQLVDADLNVIADDSFIYLDDNNGFIDFAKESSTNCMGLLDTEGNVVLPAEYGSTEVLNDRWLMGLSLTETTKEAGYDYWGFGGGYYNLDHADFYYKGEKAGTLDRAGYDAVQAFGDYLYIKDKSGNCHFYNSKFEESGASAEYCYEEYEEDYSAKKILHLGSNTEAFTEGCTLTADEVADPVYNMKGSLLDLQGNVLGDTAGYSTVYTFYSGYAMVRDGADKYGILRNDGTVIVDCIYDEIHMYEDVVPSGYVPAEKDGKFCIISLADGSEVSTEFASAAMEDPYAPFASKVSDDGKYTVISGLAGTLDETFDEATINLDGRSVLRVKKGDACGAIDLTGAYVVEADGTYTETYDLTISKDSTLILGETDEGFYIYKLSY